MEKIKTLIVFVFACNDIQQRLIDWLNSTFVCMKIARQIRAMYTINFNVIMT